MGNRNAPIVLILFAVLIGLAAYFWYKDKHPGALPSTPPETKDSIITKVDTFWKDRWRQAPEPDTVILVDSANRQDSALLQQLTRMNIYERTIWDDTMAKIYLRDTVYKNKLRGFRVDAQFFSHDTTIYRTRYKMIEMPETKKFSIYAGATMGYIPKCGLILAPTITYCSKPGQLYSAAFDPANKALILSAQWPIFKK